MTKSTIWYEDGTVMLNTGVFEPETKYVIGLCRFFDQIPPPGGLRIG